jgi:hypothetical protein
MPRNADSLESMDDVQVPKTPAPNKNMSLTADAFDTKRKTVDGTMGLEKSKPTHSKNRTMSNFRSGRELKTLNPFSTAKKSLMEGKLESLSY